jgi:hypothetical protein
MFITTESSLPVGTVRTTESTPEEIPRHHELHMVGTRVVPHAAIFDVS